jgi:hypothetical protein
VLYRVLVRIRSAPSQDGGLIRLRGVRNSNKPSVMDQGLLLLR